MMHTVELKPCNCGHTDPVEVVGVRGDRGFGVRCGKPECGWRTVGYPSREQARAAWNTRPEASLAPDAVRDWRRHEVQAIGAAISRRNWHSLETAYNQLRDKMDRALSAPAPAVEASLSDGWRDIASAEVGRPSVLVFYDGDEGWGMTMAYLTDNGWFSGPHCPVRNVTHWQPLPAPPTATSGAHEGEGV